MTTVTLVALLLACGVTLDFVTLKHRPVIFEHFYDWWRKLSDLNLEAAANSGVRWFSDRVDHVFGVKIISVRSMARGAFFVLIVAMLVTGYFLVPLDGTVPAKVAIVLASAVLVLIPGWITFQLGGSERGQS